MFSFRVIDSISLELLQQHQSEEIFELIEKRRDVPYASLSTRETQGRTLCFSKYSEGSKRTSKIIYEVKGRNDDLAYA